MLTDLRKIIILSITLIVSIAIPQISFASYCEINGSINTSYTQSECQGRGGSWKNGATPSGSCSINGSTSYNYTESECNSKGGTWKSSNSTDKGGNTSYIPGVSKGSNIGEYIKAIYSYAIGVVGILATVVIMIGGLIWITSMGNASRVNSAKEWIGAALTGLALAMFSYTILYIINRDLVDFKWTAPSKIETTTKDNTNNNTNNNNNQSDLGSCSANNTCPGGGTCVKGRCYRTR